MRLIADEGVDRAIVLRLRGDGHAVDHVAEMAPGIDDGRVLDLARGGSALLVTADKDFGELVFRQRLLSSGVLLLRLSGLPASAKAEHVARALHAHERELLGAFAVLTGRMLRIRPLPI